MIWDCLHSMWVYPWNDGISMVRGLFPWNRYVSMGLSLRQRCISMVPGHLRAKGVSPFFESISNGKKASPWYGDRREITEYNACCFFLELFEQQAVLS